jgi:hypothetical protein
MIDMEVTIMAMAKERDLLLSQLAEETRIQQALKAGMPEGRHTWRPARPRLICRALDVVQPIDSWRARFRRVRREPCPTAAD